MTRTRSIERPDTLVRGIRHARPVPPRVLEGRSREEHAGRVRPVVPPRLRDGDGPPRPGRHAGRRPRPADGGALPAEVLFGIYRGVGADVPLALNVKADGLQKWLPPLLAAYGVADCFVFDMAVPDALGWLKAGVPAFTRQSEVEPSPAFYDRAAGVWLDAFESEWWSADTVGRHLAAGKRVCVVSPDLHGRDPRAAWDALAAAPFRGDPRVTVCTDRPEEAREALGG